MQVHTTKFEVSVPVHHIKMRMKDQLDATEFEFIVE
jgi:hypothetical protein